MQNFEEEVSEHDKDLTDARNLCKQLCDGIKESSSKFDLKNKLTNVERPFHDVNKKIGELLRRSHFVPPESCDHSVLKEAVFFGVEHELILKDHKTNVLCPLCPLQLRGRRL